MKANSITQDNYLQKTFVNDNFVKFSIEVN